MGGDTAAPNQQQLMQLLQLQQSAGGGSTPPAPPDETSTGRLGTITGGISNVLINAMDMWAMRTGSAPSDPDVPLGEGEAGETFFGRVMQGLQRGGGQNTNPYRQVGMGMGDPLKYAGEGSRQQQWIKLRNEGLHADVPFPDLLRHSEKFGDAFIPDENAPNASGGYLRQMPYMEQVVTGGVQGLLQTGENIAQGAIDRGWGSPGSQYSAQQEEYHQGLAPYEDDPRTPGEIPLQLSEEQFHQDLRYYGVPATKMARDAEQIAEWFIPVGGSTKVAASLYRAGAIRGLARANRYLKHAEQGGVIAGNLATLGRKGVTPALKAAIKMQKVAPYGIAQGGQDALVSAAQAGGSEDIVNAMLFGGIAGPAMGVVIGRVGDLTHVAGLRRFYHKMLKDAKLRMGISDELARAQQAGDTVQLEDLVGYVPSWYEKGGSRFGWMNPNQQTVLSQFFDASRKKAKEIGSWFDQGFSLYNGSGITQFMTRQINQFDVSINKLLDRADAGVRKVWREPTARSTRKEGRWEETWEGVKEGAEGAREFFQTLPGLGDILKSTKEIYAEFSGQIYKGTNRQLQGSVLFPAREALVNGKKTWVPNVRDAGVTGTSGIAQSLEEVIANLYQFGEHIVQDGMHYVQVLDPKTVERGGKQVFGTDLTAKMAFQIRRVFDQLREHSFGMPAGQTLDVKMGQGFETRLRGGAEQLNNAIRNWVPGIGTVLDDMSEYLTHRMNIMSYVRNEYPDAGRTINQGIIASGSILAGYNRMAARQGMYSVMPSNLSWMAIARGTQEAVRLAMTTLPKLGTRAAILESQMTGSVPMPWDLVTTPYRVITGYQGTRDPGRPIPTEDQMGDDPNRFLSPFLAGYGAVDRGTERIATHRMTPAQRQAREERSAMTTSGEENIWLNIINAFNPLTYDFTDSTLDEEMATIQQRSATSPETGTPVSGGRGRRRFPRRKR